MATMNRLVGLLRQQVTVARSLVKANPSGMPSLFWRNISLSRLLFEETPIKMPALSPTMSAGTIVKWHKKEGDKISAGDILCEVQTDKAVVAYEFDDDGVLAKILVDENSKEVNVGELIAVVCGEDDDWKNVKVPEGFGAESSKPATTESVVSTPSKPESAPPATSGSLKISPSARNLMHHYGINSSQVVPSGPRGALLKTDVLNYITQNNLKPKDLSAESSVAKQPKAVPSKSTSTMAYVDIELTSMRRTIAKRLTESKWTTPHAYMSARIFMDNLIQLRKQLKKESISVSVNDLLVKATGLALKQVPQMNCQWNESSGTSTLLSEVDISVAVATPTGLITPIIRHANRLTVEEINTTSRDLISRAREGKLQPNEFIGGSFSISNLGMYEIDFFTGIINPPQTAILAVGATKPIFVGEVDNYQLRNRLTVSLSFDARAIEEDTAAHFLEQLQNNLEQPTALLNSDGTLNRRLSALL